MAEREMPVSMLVAVIWTLATTPPVASVTVPEMVPVPMVCANPPIATANAATGRQRRSVLPDNPVMLNPPYTCFRVPVEESIHLTGKLRRKKTQDLTPNALISVWVKIHGTSEPLEYVISRYAKMQRDHQSATHSGPGNTRGSPSVG